MLPAMPSERGSSSVASSDRAAVSAPPDFAAQPSAPRAGRLLRLMAYVLLLALACGAIWWIDRGAMLTNSHP
jgi:hypothetical protein